MHVTEETLQLVEAAYACARDRSNLPGFLAMLGRVLNARSAQLVTIGFDEASLQAAAGVPDANGHGHELAWWLALGRGSAVNLLPDGVAFALGEFPEVFGPMASESAARGIEDWQDAIGAVVSRGLEATTLVVCLPQADSPKSGAGIRAALQALLPYLSRAFVLVQSPDGGLLTLGAAGQLLKRLPMPCLITDIAGRCLEPNDAFLSMLPALSLHISGGRVRFDDPFLDSEWQSALSEAWHTAVTRTMAGCARPGKQWRMHLLPIKCVVVVGSATELPLLMALFEEHAAMQPPVPGSLSSVTKLTPAEMDVLSGLLQGYTAKVIARSRGASVNTVRSQIMAILTKTGHRSQKELIAALGASSFNSSFLPSSGSDGST